MWVQLFLQWDACPLILFSSLVYFYQKVIPSPVVSVVGLYFMYFSANILSGTCSKCCQKLHSSVYILISSLLLYSLTLKLQTTFYILLSFLPPSFPYSCIHWVFFVLLIMFLICLYYVIIAFTFQSRKILSIISFCLPPPASMHSPLCLLCLYLFSTCQNRKHKK